MKISVIQEAERARFVVEGDIDETGAATLRQRFKEFSGQYRVAEAVLDFRAVGYLSSSAVGAIILCYKTLALSGGRLRIENASRDIHELLMDLDIHKIIPIGKA